MVQSNSKSVPVNGFGLHHLTFMRQKKMKICSEWTVWSLMSSNLTKVAHIVFRKLTTSGSRSSESSSEEGTFIWSALQHQNFREQWLRDRQLVWKEPLGRACIMYNFCACVHAVPLRWELSRQKAHNF